MIDALISMAFLTAGVAVGTLLYWLLYLAIWGSDE